MRVFLLAALLLGVLACTSPTAPAITSSAEASFSGYSVSSGRADSSSAQVLLSSDSTVSSSSYAVAH